MSPHPYARILMCTLTVLLLSACKSTPKPAPEVKPESGTEIEPETNLLERFPMELPPHTAGLLSVDFARTNLVANRMITMVPPDRQPRIRREAPSAPAVHVAVAMFGDLIDEHLDIQERIEIVQHINDRGTLYMALSLQGTQDVLEAMRLGAPLSQREHVPHGALMRISIPAKNPGALMRMLQKYATVHHIERIESVGSQVEFDLRISSANARRMSSGLQPIDVDTSSDAAYFKDPSPALATFLQSDAAIKLHAPSSSFSQLAALSGLHQATLAFQYSFPTVRDKLMEGGIATASKAFALDDPTRYESEDTTILMDLTKEEHLTTSMVRSLTPYGQALAKKLATSPEQPITRKPESIFSATTSQDFDAIASDVLAPRELVLYHDRKQLLRDTGPLAFFAQVIQAPMGTRHATLAHVPDELSAAFFAHGLHVEFSPTMSKGLGMPSPNIIIDLLLPTPPPEQTSSLESEWRSLTHGMPGTEVSFDGDHIVKMTSGHDLKDTVTTMERLPERTFATAKLDLTLIAERLRALPQELTKEFSPTMFSELVRLSTVTLTATTHPTYTLWHAHTEDATDTLEVANTTRNATQPAGLPDCLIPIIKTSRDALAVISEASDPGVIHNATISQIPTLHKTCPEARAQIDQIHARWLLVRAEHAERGNLKAAALADYQRACDLDLPIACQLLEVMQKP